MNAPATPSCPPDADGTQYTMNPSTGMCDPVPGTGPAATVVGGRRKASRKASKGRKATRKARKSTRKTSRKASRKGSRKGSRKERKGSRKGSRRN